MSPRSQKHLQAMDLFFSPREKWLAIWLTLTWVSVRSGRLLVGWIQQTWRQRQLRNSQATSPENYEQLTSSDTNR
ncbi:hypothetical protein V8E54_007128 [Elaphomyces granulatus]|jgi:hypothetical protein